MNSYGAGEFDGYDGLGGLNLLQEAVAAQGVERNTPQASPAAPEVDTEEIVEVTCATVEATAAGEEVEEVVMEAQPQTELPTIASCDPLKLQAARDISKGKPISPANLTGWAPAKTKPRKQELMRAVLERDCAQRCKYWSVEKCVLFLLNTTAMVTGAESVGAPDPAAAPAVQPAPAPTQKEAAQDGAEDTSSRWSKTKAVRLLHSIVKHKVKFVARDKKLTRAELDAGAQHSCWEAICETFNGSETFDIITSKEGWDKYTSLGVISTSSSYVLEREKAMKEFGTMRTQLTKCLVNYRQSGMGNDVDDDKRREDSTKVYSDTFFTFTNGNLVLDYMYELFLKYDILESATCEMPKDAQFGVNSKRPASDSRPRQVRHRRKGVQEEQGQQLKRILAALPPVQISKTRAEKVSAKAHAMRQQLKLEEALSKMADKYSLECLRLQRELSQTNSENQVAMRSLLSEQLTAAKLNLQRVQQKQLQAREMDNMEDDSDNSVSPVASEQQLQDDDEEEEEGHGEDEEEEEDL